MKRTLIIGVPAQPLTTSLGKSMEQLDSTDCTTTQGPLTSLESQRGFSAPLDWTRTRMDGIGTIVLWWTVHSDRTPESDTVNFSHPLGSITAK